MQYPSRGRTMPACNKLSDPRKSIAVIAGSLGWSHAGAVPDDVGRQAASGRDFFSRFATAPRNRAATCR